MIRAATRMLALLLVGACMAWSGPPLLIENFSSLPLGDWAQDSTHGAWYAAPSGGEQLSIVAAGGYRYCRVAAEPVGDGPDTRAALVISAAPYAGWRELDVQYDTDQRLRTVPNPWEVGWVLFNFTDTNHFYYVLLKPDGWELGKEWQDARGVQRQDFLVTGTRPFPVGDWMHVRVLQHVSGGAVTLTVQARDTSRGDSLDTLAVFTDDGSRESGPAYPGGKIGLYAEDSVARYGLVQLYR